MPHLLIHVAKERIERILNIKTWGGTSILFVLGQKHGCSDRFSLRTHYDNVIYQFTHTCILESWVFMVFVNCFNTIVKKIIKESRMHYIYIHICDYFPHIKIIFNPQNSLCSEGNCIFGIAEYHMFH